MKKGTETYKDYKLIKKKTEEFIELLTNNHFDNDRNVNDLMEYIDFHNDMCYMYIKRKGISVGDEFAIHSAINNMFGVLCGIENVYSKEMMEKVYKATK